MPILVESSRSNADVLMSVTGRSSHVVSSLEELKNLLVGVA